MTQTHSRPGPAGPEAAFEVGETSAQISVLDAAQYMATRGGYVFPLDHPALPECVGVPASHKSAATCTERGKHPTGRWSLEATNKLTDIVAMFAGTTRNYGIDCRSSQLLVIDEDVLNLFTEHAAQRGHTIPHTFVVRSGRPGGGRHFYFRVPRDHSFTNSTGNLPKGVDVRGKGGYVVGPGSVHASGQVYLPEDWAAPFADLPGWLAEALTPPARQVTEVVDGEPLDRPLTPRIAELLDADPGDRSEQFYRLARELMEAGFTQGQAVTVLTPWCAQHDKYVGRVDAEVARCWSKPGGDRRNDSTPDGNGEAGTRPGFVAGELTDARMAETVSSAVLADQFCWTAALGWMEWDGRVWRRSDDAAVIEVVRAYVLNKFASEVQAGADSDRRKALSGLLNRGRIGAITSLARGILRQEAANFDQQPDLLNTPSGVVNLRTKELYPHDRALLFTKITEAAYRPGATHPDWTTALEAIPEDVRDWYQMRLGQGLTGYMTPDDLLVVNHGGGENGKTTVLGVSTRSLGSFYTLVSDRVLLANPDAHPTELMELRGARVGLIEETPEARRLSVARLKKVVGTPEIEARYIRQDSVTFRATHSLFLSTNYRPVVEETDHGTWRRLALVKFPYRFVVDPDQPLLHDNERRGDPTLRDRIALDPRVQEAALAWMVDGAHRWYQNDKIMPRLPKQVELDTRDWRVASDLVLSYIDDRLVPDVARHIASTDLLADFNDWLLARGHQKWADKMFTSRFGEHDEVTRHRIVKRVVRAPDGASRPVTQWIGQVSSPLPGRYTAWLGVRFATADDTRAEQGGEAPSTRGGKGGKADSGDIHDHSHGVFTDSALPPLPPPAAAPAPGVGSAPLRSTSNDKSDPNYCPRCRQTFPSPMAWLPCDRCGDRTHARGRGAHGMTCQTCLTERTSA
jgi:putative DNA primase/helicase